MPDSRTDDIVELNQLAYRYARAIDTCDEDMLARVFAADGRVRVYPPGADEPMTDMQGTDQILNIPRLMRDAHCATMHQMTNHLIDFDASGASGTVLCTARHLDLDGKSALNVLIRYEDRYVHGADGWKIQDRAIRFLWNEVHPALSDAFLETEGAQ